MLGYFGAAQKYRDIEQTFFPAKRKAKVVNASMNFGLKHEAVARETLLKYLRGNNFSYCYEFHQTYEIDTGTQGILSTSDGLVTFWQKPPIKAFADVDSCVVEIKSSYDERSRYIKAYNMAQVMLECFANGTHHALYVASTTDYTTIFLLKRDVQLFHEILLYCDMIVAYVNQRIDSAQLDEKAKDIRQMINDYVANNCSLFSVTLCNDKNIFTA